MIVRAKPNRGWLTTAIFTAALALFVNSVVTLWSNYLTRRDQHIQEADKCNDLTASLISTTSFASDATQAAASTIEQPIQPGSSTKRFILPPID
jgi:hypothetical protein